VPRTAASGILPKTCERAGSTACVGNRDVQLEQQPLDLTQCEAEPRAHGERGLDRPGCPRAGSRPALTASSENQKTVRSARDADLAGRAVAPTRSQCTNAHHRGESMVRIPGDHDAAIWAITMRRSRWSRCSVARIYGADLAPRPLSHGSKGRRFGHQSYSGRAEGTAIVEWERSVATRALAPMSRLRAISGSS